MLNTQPTSGRNARRAYSRGTIVIVLAALVVGAGLMIDTKLRQSHAQDASRRASSADFASFGAHNNAASGVGGLWSQPGSGGQESRSVSRSPDPVLLAAALRDLKLVTVRIDHQVVARAGTESWRGDVRAEVTGTATSLYGVDLSALNAQSISVGALTGEVRVRVPPPMRLATEIATPGEQLTSSVQVGWGRLRDVAGEFYLGQARARLHEAARSQALSTEQREEVRILSREQVARLVSAIVRGASESKASARDPVVAVEFDEPEVGP